MAAPWRTSSPANQTPTSAFSLLFFPPLDARMLALLPRTYSCIRAPPRTVLSIFTNRNLSVQREHFQKENHVLPWLTLQSCANGHKPKSKVFFCFFFSRNYSLCLVFHFPFSFVRVDWTNEPHRSSCSPWLALPP